MSAQSPNRKAKFRAGWAIGTVTLAAAFGAFANNPNARLVAAGLVCLTGALLYAAIHEAKAWWARSTWCLGAALTLVVGGVVVSASGESGGTDSTKSSLAPATTSSSAPSTNPVPSTIVPTTTTRPEPAGPAFPPDERVIYQSKSAEFFDGALLLANRSTGYSIVDFTVTTNEQFCSSGYLHAGERFVVAGNAVGNRYFRLTVLEIDPDASSTRVRVEDLPPQDWPQSKPSCRS